MVFYYFITKKQLQTAVKFHCIFLLSWKERNIIMMVRWMCGVSLKYTRG